ncbi:MAG: hypothetical protein ACM3US_02630 [Sphingomonadaceae bacterium]
MIATIRDVAIIILAFESILLLLVLLFIAWKAYQLMGFVRSKTEEFSAVGRAVLDSARETAGKASETATTVKGSAEFLSDTVVSPVVQVVSAVAGAKGFVTALFGASSTSKDGGHR